MMRVLHYPEQNLRHVAAPVLSFGTDELRSRLDEMFATMRRLNGIGLAATQVGIHEQIAVIEIPGQRLVLINPTIANPSKKLLAEEEGCLSVPGVFGYVSRSASLTVKAQDEHGKQFQLKAQGLLARVIQHEVDHLNGTLYIDRCYCLTSGLDVAKNLGLSIPPLTTA